MSAKPNAQRLAVVSEPEYLTPLGGSSLSATIEPVICSFCFGTRMEVLAGKGGTPLSMSYT